MSNFLILFALAAMPAAGNFAGGLLAEAIPVSRQTLSLALHAAAGIVLAVVGVELIPRGLESTSVWVVVLALMLGGGLFLAMDAATGYIQSRFSLKGAGGESEADEGSVWAGYIAVCVDLFSDGVLIGTGSVVSGSLGFLLALGQVPADVPEGFATVATLKARRIRRSTRLLLSAAFAVAILLGATLGYWLLRDAPAWAQMGVLVATAGILLAASVEEIMIEAHRAAEPRFGALALVGGFALFILVAELAG